MIYNLQYFAEETEVKETEVKETEQEESVDLDGLLDLITAKDNEINDMRKEITELKKANAQMLVRINSNAGGQKAKSFEESLLELAGDKPRKE